MFKKLRFILSIVLKKEKFNNFYSLVNKYPDYIHLFEWAMKDFPIPHPQIVKQTIFKKYNLSEAIWIETGTWHGTSTKYLSSIAEHVYSLEPHIEIYKQVKEKLAFLKNVTIINKSSETGFEQLVKDIPGNSNVCFWLDGHNSGENTFQGNKVSPIEYELSVVEKELHRFNAVRILIDDIRLFHGDNEGMSYPNKFYLVNWIENNNLTFEIESDIAIIKYK